jgi:hypothetical protein
VLKFAGKMEMNGSSMFAHVLVSSCVGSGIVAESVVVLVLVLVVVVVLGLTSLGPWEEVRRVSGVAKAVLFCNRPSGRCARPFTVRCVDCEPVFEGTGAASSIDAHILFHRSSEFAVTVSIPLFSAFVKVSLGVVVPWEDVSAALCRANGSSDTPQVLVNEGVDAARCPSPNCVALHCSYIRLHEEEDMMVGKLGKNWKGPMT